MLERNMSRRAVLAAMPVVGAAVALSAGTLASFATVPATAHETPDLRALQGLIEAHRKADADYAELEEYACDLAVDLMALPPIRVPISVGPNGERLSGYVELSHSDGADKVAEIRAGIVRSHENARRIHCSSWSMSMVPPFVEAMRAEIDRSEARALAELSKAVDAAGHRDALLGTAEETADAALDTEQSARVALLLYRPRTDDEVALKTSYMSSSDVFNVESDGRCCSEPFVRKLLAALGEVR